MNKATFKTAGELKAVIDYILFDYDLNVSNIADKKPEVIIQEMSNVFCVKIQHTGEIIPAHNSSLDPATHKEDVLETITSEFTLLKTEGFFALQKYVHDICDEMSK